MKCLHITEGDRLVSFDVARTSIEHEKGLAVIGEALYHLELTWETQVFWPK